MDRLSLPEDCLMHRFYAEPDQILDGLVELSRDDTRHALTVLRQRRGNRISRHRRRQRTYSVRFAFNRTFPVCYALSGASEGR